jgi:hypothetical protein
MKVIAVWWMAGMVETSLRYDVPGHPTPRTQTGKGPLSSSAGPRVRPECRVWGKSCRSLALRGFPLRA